MKGDPLNPDDWLRIVTLDYARVLRAMDDDDAGPPRYGCNRLRRKL